MSEPDRRIDVCWKGALLLTLEEEDAQDNTRAKADAGLDNGVGDAQVRLWRAENICGKGVEKVSDAKVTVSAS